MMVKLLLLLTQIAKLSPFIQKIKSGVRYGITGYFSAALEVQSMAHQALKRHPCRRSKIPCYSLSPSFSTPSVGIGS